MKLLVIYGLGDFAKMMRYYFSKDSNYEVIAFCADKLFIKEDKFDGLPLVAFEDIQDLYPSSDFLMFVAVGYSKMRARKVMFERALDKNYQFVNYVSSRADIDSSAIIGLNNVFLQGVQVEPFCKIGDNNIIWSSVNICHDSIVGNHCFLASQSLLGGFSVVGDNSFIGFNATVIQQITLAEETLVGTKSLILKNTAAYSKNVGIPSQCISFHSEHGIIIK